MALVSPGVEWRELDFSAYAIQLAATVFAVAGEAFQGKEVPVEILGPNDMTKKLGIPSTDFKDYSLYALDQFFKVGRRALFQRVIRSDAVRAETPDVVDVTPQNLFRLKAYTKGDWANDYALTIDEVDATTHEFDFVIGVMDPSGLTSNYIEVERFDAVTMDPKAERYVETMVNDGINGVLPSELGIVVIDGGFSWDPNSPTHPVAGTYVFGDVGDGGVAGEFGATPPTTSQYLNALDLMKDPETYDINLIGVPGLFNDIAGNDDVSIAGKIKEICEIKRQDCMGLIDPPKSVSTPDYSGSDIIADVKTWRSNLAHDSSYTCIFWPWIKVLDTYNNKKVWIPPSGVVAQRMAYTDLVAGQWFSPAGLNRGVLSGIQDIGFITDQDHRDLLYDRRVNINVIKKEPGEGFVLWGNRTNQSKPTARDQIPVRRMLLYLQKIVATSVKYLVFEPNDPIMWDTFIALVTPVFEDIKTKRGMEDYDVIMDETTNTSLVKSRKEAYGILKIIPQSTAEIIKLDYILYPSGASFK